MLVFEERLFAVQVSGNSYVREMLMDNFGVVSFVVMG